MKMADELAKLRNENNELKKKLEEAVSQIGKLNDEIAELKGQNKTKNASKLMIQKSSIWGCALPAELLNELFAALPFKNAFDILAKMPNGLLGRNVRKMFKSVEMAMKNNKWNTADCGPKLRIFEGDLEVKNFESVRWYNCVRSNLPIPKMNLYAKSIAIYFEVEILQRNRIWSSSIQIGFCNQQFPLEGRLLGEEKNSIGISYKGAMRISGLTKLFGNGLGGDFKPGDVVGLGIIRFPANLPTMKCFATCNRKLLGMIKLPVKFSTHQLFPAVNLNDMGESVRANFGQNKWFYNFERIFQTAEKT